MLKIFHVTNHHNLTFIVYLTITTMIQTEIIKFTKKVYQYNNKQMNNHKAVIYITTMAVVKCLKSNKIIV